MTIAMLGIGASVANAEAELSDAEKGRHRGSILLGDRHAHRQHHRHGDPVSEEHAKEDRDDDREWCADEHGTPEPDAK
jgi:hypothetical protein